MAQRPQLEFWFDFGSNYSYLATMRIDALAAAHGVDVVRKPVLLGPVFQSLGWSTSPFVLQQAKGRYVWRDMERQCRKYRLPWRQPSSFPRRALLPLRVALAGAEQAWISAFCRRIMHINFVDDQDIDNEALVSAVLCELSLPAQTLIGAAQTDAVKAALRAQTDQALVLGLFGAPSFRVGDELFWGNDRLDEAIAWACRAPREAPHGQV